MTFATSLKAIRLTHHYIDVFFAPTILFFAITGSLQMFGLHKTSRGSSYVPPAILVHLSQLHKEETLYLPPEERPLPRSQRPMLQNPLLRSLQRQPSLCQHPTHFQ